MFHSVLHNSLPGPPHCVPSTFCTRVGLHTLTQKSPALSEPISSTLCHPQCGPDDRPNTYLNTQNPKTHENKLIHIHQPCLSLVPSSLHQEDSLLLPCPATLSAVNTTRTQLAQLLTAYRPGSLNAVITPPTASDLLAGCIILLPVSILTDESWSASHAQLAEQGQGINKCSSSVVRHGLLHQSSHITAVDHTDGLRARQVAQVTPGES